MRTTATEFSKKVFQVIRAVPKGKVATYGQIAALAGKPQGSRGVGWLLHSSTKTQGLPWQRIIKSGGRLSFPQGTSAYQKQKRLLEKEGVVFENGRVNLNDFQWKKKPKVLKNGRPLPKMFS